QQQQQQATAAGDVASSGTQAEQPAYMRQVESLALSFASVLPATLPALTTDTSDDHSAQQIPLFRVIERENSVSRKLLENVLADLAQLREVCRGERKQTNHLRQLLSDFSAGVVPRSWVTAYTVPRDYSLAKWIGDFASRLEQSRTLAERIQRNAVNDPSGAAIVRELQAQRMWLGGLLYPEAFITATRQAVAKQLQCSLEELEIAVSLDGDGSEDTSDAFAISGLRIEGAVWSSERKALSLNDGAAERLAVCYLRWMKRRTHRQQPSQSVANIPVYLNMDRSGLLFEARLSIDMSDGSTTADAIAQRAVAIIAA
ncbi:dynein heavy chain, partial [Coemansia sp. RSA 2399]